MATPVNTPVEPTDATEGLLLLHVPPEVVLVKVAVEPTHTLLGPAMGAGGVIMVIEAGPKVLTQAVAGSVAVTIKTSPDIGAQTPKSIKDPVPVIKVIARPFLYNT